MQPFLVCCFIKCQNETQIPKDASENTLAYLIAPFIKSTTPLASCFYQNSFDEIYYERIMVLEFLLMFVCSTHSSVRSGRLQKCSFVWWTMKLGPAQDTTLQSGHLNFVIPFFFVEHTLNRIHLLPRANVLLCRDVSSWVTWLMEGVCLPNWAVCSQGTRLSYSIRSLTNESPKC